MSVRYDIQNAIYTELDEDINLVVRECEFPNSPPLCLKVTAEYPSSYDIYDVANLHDIIYDVCQDRFYNASIVLIPEK